MARGKELKKRARVNMRRHWLPFVALCLVASLLGSEFRGALTGLATRTREGVLAGEVVTGHVFSAVSLYDTLKFLTQSDEDIQREVQQRQEETRAQEGQVLGRSQGIFAAVVNGLSTGSLWAYLLSVLTGMLHSRNIGVALIILSTGAFSFAFWFFIRNVFRSASRRLFLEGRVYDKIPVSHVLFFRRVRRWRRAACTLFLTALYLFLWWFTLIGGAIKTFSYFLVPYLVAENPDIKPREAIALSRRMMNGHKWECFVHYLSFIGWWALSAATFGLSGILWSNPYQVAVFSEYYVELRQAHLAEHPEDERYFNDPWLFEKAPAERLRTAYAKELAQIKVARSLPRLSGFSGFVARNFGVIFHRGAKERAYEALWEDRERLRLAVSEAGGERYPMRLSPLEPKDDREKFMVMRPTRCYSIWSLVALFFLFSIVGWLWETALLMVQSGQMVNRGVLHGPWLPIYGAGAGLILVFLYRLRGQPVAEFFSAMALCGVLEYTTGLVLEAVYGQKWWDYSGYFLNLHGRICAEGLVVFAVGGFLAVYLLAPCLDEMLKKLPRRAVKAFCLVLLFLFCADGIYSLRHPNTGAGVTDNSLMCAVETADRSR